MIANNHIISFSLPCILLIIIITIYYLSLSLCYYYSAMIRSSLLTHLHFTYCYLRMKRLSPSSFIFLFWHLLFLAPSFYFITANLFVLTVFDFYVSDDDECYSCPFFYCELWCMHQFFITTVCVCIWNVHWNTCV